MRRTASGPARELGKLAADRSGTKSIDDFGRRMAKDHGDANSKLASLARGAKVELPKDLDAGHTAVRQQLRSLPTGPVAP